MTHILHIDDFKDLSKLMEVLFFEDGVIVDHADNGQIALAKTSQSNYSLIITDLDMPLMNGVEFITSFRHSNALTPIVVLSGNQHTPELQSTLSDLGVSAIFEKPLDNLGDFYSKVLGLIGLKKEL